MLNFKLPGFHKTLIVRDEKGFTLIEVLAAIVITAILSLSIYMAISTSTKVLVLTNKQETAKDFAASDMEYIRSLPYSDTYTLPTPSLAYTNYSQSVLVTFLRTNEQRIDITITWGGKTVFTLTDFRVNY
jgi:prepilin-type N-terminal cleavage/methylation domain-containing protein